MSNQRSCDAQLRKRLYLKSVVERVAMAKDEGTAIDVLVALSRDAHEPVRARVADNCTTPPGVLDTLSSDRSPNVRTSVARNPSTPVETLQRMAAEESMLVVKWSITFNPAADEDTLRTLADGGDQSILLSVCGHRNTPSDILRKFAEHYTDNVKEKVAGNRSAPTDVLDKLANIGYGTEAIGVSIREAVAANTSCLPETLRRLAKDAGIVVLINASANPSTDGAALRELMHSAYVGVRRNIARREDAPEDVLNHLATDADPSVRRAVFTNISYQHAQ